MADVNIFEEVWHKLQFSWNNQSNERAEFAVIGCKADLFFVDRSGENTLNSRTPESLSSSPELAQQEEFSEYVAHLQLHMALQARNLVPRLTATPDSREQLLHQTQANFEKFASRQMF